MTPHSDLADAVSALRRWYATVDGKIAIYGTLFFLAITLGEYSLARILMRDVTLGPHQYISKLLIPCRDNGIQYLYGARVTDATTLEAHNVCRNALVFH
jgi:hypothetical protein